MIAAITVIAGVVYLYNYEEINTIVPNFIWPNYKSPVKGPNTGHGPAVDDALQDICDAMGGKKKPPE